MKIYQGEDDDYVVEVLTHPPAGEEHIEGYEWVAIPELDGECYLVEADRLVENTPVPANRGLPF